MGTCQLARRVVVDTMLTLLLLTWGSVGYVVWLWWLHNLNQREPLWFKVVGILGGTFVGVIWPLLLACYMLFLLMRVAYTANPWNKHE